MDHRNDLVATEELRRTVRPVASLGVTRYHLPVAPFHLLGDTRQAAEASGFFRWFNLEPAGEESPTPTRRAAYYRPEGPAFHALTELLLSMDESDRLSGLELRLARRFIDDPCNGLFARDIAKSLLRDSLTGENAKLLADLSNEIEFPRDLSVPVFTARTVEVALPAEPTPGYLVFLGRRGRYEERLRGKTLIMENYVREGTPWFRMVVALS